MRFDKSMLLLYAVTDRAWTGEKTLYQQVEEAVSGGATMIQIREKDMEEEAFLQEACQIRELTRTYGIPLIINDNIKVAIACGADGVHVGQEDMEVSEARRILGPDKIIGVTAKTVEQAKRAEEHGADYLGSGAVFGSATKKNAVFMSKETLDAICQSVSIPVVAIGGIHRGNVSELKGTGIAGIAVVSGIFGAQDIRQEAEELLREAEKAIGKVQTAGVQAIEDSDSEISTAVALPPVLTIAGSDCSGGAGIQADLKTMAAFGTYGMSVITSLTAQNTMGVEGIFDVTPEFAKKQLDCVFQDIPPMAVKIGMVSQTELIEAIAEKLRQYRARHVVLDPVMVSTSGNRLLAEDAVTALTKRLFPLAELITPNIPEARELTGMEIEDAGQMEEAARGLGKKFQTAVLLKGGHQVEEASDVLYQPKQDSHLWFPGTRIDTRNTHGTGCTLSSAIACGLAKGMGMEESIRAAKAYVRDALSTGLDLGRGNGPLNHCVLVENKVYCNR